MVSPAGAQQSEMDDFCKSIVTEGPPQGRDPPEISLGMRRQECQSARPGFSSAQPGAGRHQGGEPLISGPKFFVPDILYAPSDVDPADIVPFNEEDFADDPGDRADSHSVAGHEICISSWNLAGTSEKKVKHLLAHVPCCDVLAVQEFPRQKNRWQILKGEVFHAVLYQDILMYRAVGIFYKSELFHLKQRVSSSKGIWLKLQHKLSQKHIWVGSVHLPNNEPRDEVNRLAHDFFQAAQHQGEQAFAMGDFNIQFKWAEEAGQVQAGHISAKWDDLRRIATEAGFQQVAPRGSQINVATFHSRKGNVASTQIDGAFTSNSPDRTLTIEEGSRHEIGTDHERIALQGWVRGDAAARVVVGGPRVVKGRLPDMHRVDQHTLGCLAKQYTKPASLGPKFKASAAVNTLRDIARHSKAAEDWKTYLHHLRREKSEWKGERVQKAAGDWKSYKYLTKQKKAWGDEFMAKCEHADPVAHVVDYFSDVFHDKRVPDIARTLHHVTENIVGEGRCTPFSDLEIRQAIQQGKNGKAVGPDLVPVELLKSMVESPVTMRSLALFFNHILQTGETPVEWDSSLASLIPKLCPPGEAKNLRPIALASHVAKTFSRLLLSRMQSVFQPRGEKQFACKHRQPAEMAWLAIQVTHLVREWQADCYMLKLDLRRAFDSVSREKLAGKIIQWADGNFPFEVRCMVRLLASTDVILALPWDDVPLHSNTGVKQGSTESPALFARLVDDILGSVDLADEGEILPQIGNDGCAFMDDVVTWKKTIGSLQAFVDRLLPRLAEFGLHVQPTKSKLLCLRGSRHVQLNLGGEMIKPIPEDETFTILNLPISQKNTEMTILYALLDKARSKFGGIHHILTSNAPLKKRVDILNKVVKGTFAWVVGILFPSAAIQTTLNHFQYCCIRRMMGLKRLAGETWVEGEARMLRIARAMVHRLEEKRWGDCAVLAYWSFTGHRVRGLALPFPSAAARLSQFRSLQWWNQEQTRGEGRRHGRHFPFLMNSERRVARVIGSEDWQVAALNRHLGLRGRGYSKKPSHGLPIGKRHFAIERNAVQEVAACELMPRCALRQQHW